MVMLPIATILFTAMDAAIVSLFHTGRLPLASPRQLPLRASSRANGREVREGRGLRVKEWWTGAYGSVLVGRYAVCVSREGLE